MFLIQKWRLFSKKIFRQLFGSERFEQVLFSLSCYSPFLQGHNLTNGISSARSVWKKIPLSAVAKCLPLNLSCTRAVVVAQLVEWLLPSPEVYGSSPVIGKHLYWTFTVNCIEKMKIKKKRPGMAHFLKKLKLYEESGTEEESTL